MLMDYLHSDHKFVDVTVFVNIVWYYSFSFIESHLKENGDDVVLDVSREKFTKVTSKLFAFMDSDSFSEIVCGLVNEEDVSRVHLALLSQFAIKIYNLFLWHLKEVVKKDVEEEAVVINVDDMGASGKAKVRHVGGWVVRKILEKARKYVQRNLFTANSATLSSVKKAQPTYARSSRKKLLALILNWKKRKLSIPRELVTENLQFRSRGLIHISDRAYKFFLSLEQQRVILLNDSKLKKDNDLMVEKAHQEMLNNDVLKAEWLDCFTVDLVSEESM